MKTLRGVVGAVLAYAVTLASPAQATVTFTLTNVSFDSGFGASGSFTTSDDFTNLLKFNVKTDDGIFFAFGNPMFTAFGDGFTYSHDTAAGTITKESLELASGAQIFQLRFAPLALGENGVRGFESAAIFTRTISSGQLVGTAVTEGTTAVPESSTWAMMIGGFGAIGGAARYRRRNTKTAYA